MAKRRTKKQGRPVTSSEIAAAGGIKNINIAPAPKPKPKPKPSKPMGPPAPKPKPITGPVKGVTAAEIAAAGGIKNINIVAPSGNRPKGAVPAKPKPKTLPARNAPGRRAPAAVKAAPARAAVGAPPKKKVSTSSPAVKAAVNKAVAPKTAKVGDKRYRVVDVNGQRKLMLNAKADAYEAQQAAQLIPSNLRGLVDPLAIKKSVDSAIATANAPITAENTANQLMLQSNMRRNGELTAGTQASIQQALAQQNMLTGGMGAATQQMRDAILTQSQRTAQAQQAALGGMANLPALSQNVDVAAYQALKDANITRDGNAAQYGSQAQANYFTRAGAIAAQSAAEWERNQRDRLAQVAAINAGKTSANEASRADLMRKYAQEDYTLASAFSNGQADADAKLAAANVDMYNAQTSRAKVSTDAKTKLEAARIAAAAKSGAAKDAAGLKLSTAQQKAVTDVRQTIDKMVAQTRKPTATRIDKDGGVVQVTPSMGDVFGKDNGPWREAFNRLTSPEIGLSPAQAAMWASQWYKQSITGSNPKNILIMLTKRGVPTSVAKKVITTAFGAKAWTKLTTKAKPKSNTISLPGVSRGTGPGGMVTTADLAGG